MSEEQNGSTLTDWKAKIHKEITQLNLSNKKTVEFRVFIDSFFVFLNMNYKSSKQYNIALQNNVEMKKQNIQAQERITELKYCLRRLGHEINDNNGFNIPTKLDNQTTLS